MSLQKTNIAKAQYISSPMASSCKLTKIGSNLFSDPTMYRSVVGALQYLTITRPEICFAVNKVFANSWQILWILHGLHLKTAIWGFVMQTGNLI